jgi:tRNA (guanine37-N1)-methyltransferase
MASHTEGIHIDVYFCWWLPLHEWKMITIRLPEDLISNMSLHSLLQNKLPPEKFALLPKHFEVIGDIAIINIPHSLDTEKHLIAEALSFQRKDIKTVLRKLNKIEGAARVADFELLLGDRTTTLHRENGLRLLPGRNKNIFFRKNVLRKGQDRAKSK